MKNFVIGLILLVSINLASMAHAESKVYFSPNGGCQAAVISKINDAHKSIYVAMYSFTSREIANALAAAKERHVKVKVILDTFEIKDRFSKSRYLINKDINLKFHMGNGLMHNKFAVIDGRTVLTGSFNWTVTADTKNDENLLVITDKELAQKYVKQFNRLWAKSGEGQMKGLPAEKTDADSQVKDKQ
jgi:phosphatidylserine/phosphatidylglycerophosphate/cardiolipin synthase-like enzyme